MTDATPIATPSRVSPARGRGPRSAPAEKRSRSRGLRRRAYRRRGRRRPCGMLRHLVRRLLALLAIVGLAAYLRFSGLDWGHRHPMHTDEQLFVENAVAMLDAGDLDHRFYRYPGLFIYMLAAGIAPLGAEAWHTNDAYI